MCPGNQQTPHAKQGIPVGTPYLEGFPPSQEIPSLPWITSLVGALLKISVGTLRFVSTFVVVLCSDLSTDSTSSSNPSGVTCDVIEHEFGCSSDNDCV